jgi:hypothetical protein
VVLIGSALFCESDGRGSRLFSCGSPEGPLVSRDEAESKPAGQTKAQFQKSWDAWKGGRSWKRCSDLRLRIIVLSFVRFNPLSASKPCGPRGAFYLRGRSANPRSFAFRRTSTSSRQRKLPVSRARWSTGMSKRRRRGPRGLGSARGSNYYPARRMHGAGRIRWTNMR